jgi:hypothetical protein
MINHACISDDHKKNQMTPYPTFEMDLKIGAKYLFYYGGYIPGSLA